MSLGSNSFRVFLTGFEGDDSGGGADAGGGQGGNPAGSNPAGGNPAGQGGGGGDENIRDQNHLNAVLKRERIKTQQQMQQQIQQLEEFKQRYAKTEEEKTQFEQQIEELRSANLSTEEKARREKERLQKEYDNKLTAAAGEAKAWQTRFSQTLISQSLNTAADKHGVIPQNKKFADSFLGPRTRTAEIVDPDGKPTGQFAVRVKFPDVDKDGNPVEVDLSPDDAFKRMKDLPEEYGYLFEAHTPGGLGAQSGQARRGSDPTKMSDEQYYAARKKNRGALYEAIDKRNK